MNKFKLNFLHLCDSAFLSKENKLNVIGIFDSVYVDTVPGTLLKATLVGNLTVLNRELEKVNLKIIRLLFNFSIFFRNHSN